MYNEHELLKTETPNKSPITCSKVLVVNILKALGTCCIGVSSSSVLANGQVLSKAKTRSKIFVIIFLQRVTSVPKEPNDEFIYYADLTIKKTDKQRLNLPVIRSNLLLFLSRCLDMI